MILIKRIIAGITIIIVLIGVGFFGHFQNGFQALHYFFQYTPEEQVQLEQENEQRMEELLRKTNLTTEKTDNKVNIQKDNIEAAKKENTASEGVSSSKDNTAVSKKDFSTESNILSDESEFLNVLSNEEFTSNDKEQNYDYELAEMIGEIYALRSQFVGELDNLLEQAKAEYYTLSPEERKKQKSSIAGKYIGMAGDLEASCDKQMEDILKRMRTHLKETGVDVSLVDEIRGIYEDEKALKKSFYMSKLK